MRRKPLTINAMTTPKPLAEQLREAIRGWNGTRQELAERADVSKQVIDKFMTVQGKTINLETAEKLGKALGISVLRL